MLETIYNDFRSQLTLLHAVDRGVIMVVTSDLKNFGEINYDVISPSNEDIIELWQKATSEYFGDNHIVKDLSDKDFAEWLEKEGYEK